MEKFSPKMSPWIVKFRRQVIVLTLLVCMIVAWEVYRTKSENYTLLWQRVNSIWSVYCEDVPIETCRPSLNFPCEKCD